MEMDIACYHDTPTIKSHCYNTFVHPMHPQICWYEQNIYTLEIVQRRAARFVMNEYMLLHDDRTASVSKMLNALHYNGVLERNIETVYEPYDNIVQNNSQHGRHSSRTISTVN